MTVAATPACPLLPPSDDDSRTVPQLEAIFCADYYVTTAECRMAVLEALKRNCLNVTVSHQHTSGLAGAGLPYTGREPQPQPFRTLLTGSSDQTRSSPRSIGARSSVLSSSTGSIANCGRSSPAWCVSRRSITSRCRRRRRARSRIRTIDTKHAHKHS